MKKQKRDEKLNIKRLLIGLLLVVVGVFLIMQMIAKFFLHKQSSQNIERIETHQDAAVTELESETVNSAEQSDIEQLAVTDEHLEALESEAVSGGRLASVHGLEGGHLVTLPKQYTSKQEKVHKETYQALIDMMTAAQADGVRLVVVSAFRSHSRQKEIWERKWGGAQQNDKNRAMDILKWSSFPGTSRHHWGTDVDFNSVNPAYWEAGEGARAYHWLQDNAHKYGFCQVYGAGRSKGYSEEKWHWSHLPVADRFYGQISQNSILQLALNQNVKGAQAVQNLGVAMDYVTGINSCSVSMYAPAMKAQKNPSSQSSNITKARSGEAMHKQAAIQDYESVEPKSFHSKPPLGPEPFVSYEGVPITPVVSEKGVLISEN